MNGLGCGCLLWILSRVSISWHVGIHMPSIWICDCFCISFVHLIIPTCPNIQLMDKIPAPAEMISNLLKELGLAIIILVLSHVFSCRPLELVNNAGPLWEVPHWEAFVLWATLVRRSCKSIQVPTNRWLQDVLYCTVYMEIVSDTFGEDFMLFGEGHGNFESISRALCNSSFCSR